MNLPPLEGVWPTLVALATSAVGVIVGAGAFFAQAASPDVAPYVSGGGAFAAVGGLVYVTKKVVSGELVALPVGDLVKNANHREDELVRILRDAAAREDDYRTFLLARRARGDDV